jgi:hypothetical protein
VFCRILRSYSAKTEKGGLPLHITTNRELGLFSAPLFSGNVIVAFGNNEEL